MVRVRESIEDEDRGWGVRKSPLEYDGNTRNSVPFGSNNNYNPARIAEALERQARQGDPNRFLDSQRNNKGSQPGIGQRKIRAGELWDKYNELPKPGEVMDGLVPIGDSGLYSVPDDAAKPNDCERWPDSPACSNQPLSAVPIGFEDQEIVVDDCNLGFGI